MILGAGVDVEVREGGGSGGEPAGMRGSGPPGCADPPRDSVKSREKYLARRTTRAGAADLTASRIPLGPVPRRWAGCLLSAGSQGGKVHAKLCWKAPWSSL